MDTSDELLIEKGRAEVREEFLAANARTAKALVALAEQRVGGPVPEEVRDRIASASGVTLSVWLDKVVFNDNLDSLDSLLAILNSD